MKISQEFLHFNNEVNVSVPYMTDALNKTRLKIDDTQATSMTSHLIDWNIFFAKYMDPSEHTEPVVTDLQNLFAVFHPEILGIKQQIKNNKTVVLTGNDYAKISIHKDAEQRSHVPRPTVSPINEVKKQYHLITEIFTHSSAPEHLTETHLPVDVVKIGRKIVITAIDESQPELSKFQPIEAIGVTEYKLTFTPDQVGKRAWLITCYINPTGEEGPYSEVISFIII